MDEIVSWETDFMPVEAPLPQERWRSRSASSNCCANLTTTQGLLERKTTIPILSTYSRPLETACLDASG
jgi:hypothetical protein